MKVYTLLIFILIFKVLYAGNYHETLYGNFEPSGFSSSIYTTTLDETLISITNPGLSVKYPSLNSLDLYFIPNNNLSVKLKKRDDRYNLLLGYSGNYKNLYVEQFNISSNNDFDLDRVIHHGLMIKRTGIITTGFIYIKTFSPTLISGDKIILFNRLSLYNLEFLSLLESRKNYITPLYTTQEDMLKSKAKITYFISKDLILDYKNDLTQNIDYILRENFLKITFIFPKNILSMEFGIRDKTDRELSLKTTVNNIFNIFHNEVSCKIRYINAPLINFNISSNIKIRSFCTIKTGYYYEHILGDTHELRCKFVLKTKNWDLNIGYTQPINSVDEFWSVDGSITLN